MRTIWCWEPEGNAYTPYAAGRTETGTTKLRLCLFMVSEKAQKNHGKKTHITRSIYGLSFSWKIVQGNVSGNPSILENSTSYTLRKGIPRYPCQMQAAQPLPVPPRITLDVKVWKALKQGQHSGVGSCFHVSSCHVSSDALMAAWGWRSHLGMEQRTGHGAQPCWGFVPAAGVGGILY